MKRPRVITIIGTRPEAIKMAPVKREIAGRKDKLDHMLVATAQHRELLDQVLSVFQLRPEIDLDLMQPDQQLSEFAARSLESLSKLFSELKPDLLLVQGDTTTVMTAALAAFYQRILIGHVEAGLRSFDLRNPFPEEMNRRLVGGLADLHFAATPLARTNLLSEGISDDKIHVTGNTIVDALSFISLNGRFDDVSLNNVDFEKKRIILVTAHRRENHGAPLKSICHALKMLVNEFQDIEIVFPVHLNPAVRAVVNQEMKTISRVRLIEPLTYHDLLQLLKSCYLILTDSGGLQEESPSFHKPVLILREKTERPEVVQVGAGKIVGTDAHRVFSETSQLLNKPEEYKKMCSTENPFGDGYAAKRIVNI